MSKLTRIGLGFLLLIAVVLAVTSSYIILSGNQYLFFTLQHTVFKGRLGPTIDEFEIYPSRLVETSEIKGPWAISSKSHSLSEEEMAYHRSLATAAFVVIKNDSLLFEYYDEEHSDSSYTNSWSMAKSIISLLVGIAIDEGLIENEEVLLSNYFEQYKGSEITLKHLLTMSSGINFTEDYIDPFAHSTKSLYSSDLIELNKDYFPVNPPGIHFDYQGGNTILLAMVLTKVTGRTISELASEKLWQPMQAEHSAYWSLDHEGGLEKAFCCFNSNARDMARFGKLILQHGVWNGDTLVSSSYLKKALSPADLLLDDGSRNNYYGYQWWMSQMPKYLCFYARGIQGQYIIVLPAEKLIIVRLGDARTGKYVQGHPTDMLRYIDMARRLASQ